MSAPSYLRPIDILLVEDNPGDVRLTQETFEEAKGAHGVSSQVAESIEIVEPRLRVLFHSRTHPRQRIKAEGDEEIVLRQRVRRTERVFLTAALIVIHVTNYVTPKTRYLLNTTGFFGW